MTTRRVTTPTERIDLLIRQVEQFLALDLVHEAIARARAAMALCAQEVRLSGDEPRLHREIEQRRGYLDTVLRKLGASPPRGGRQHATI